MEGYSGYERSCVIWVWWLSTRTVLGDKWQCRRHTHTQTHRDLCQCMHHAGLSTGGVWVALATDYHGNTETGDTVAGWLWEAGCQVITQAVPVYLCPDHLYSVWWQVTTLISTRHTRVTRQPTCSWPLWPWPLTSDPSPPVSGHTVPCPVCGGCLWLCTCTGR